MQCVFCEIIRGAISSFRVFEDEVLLAFLDSRPLFPGHALVVPKQHYETLVDLPGELVGPLFSNARALARAIEQELGAEGSFVAVNNRVSQSVPHLHIHVVPRRKKDGLKGFFWPRTPYKSEEEMAKVGELLRGAMLRKAEF